MRTMDTTFLTIGLLSSTRPRQPQVLAPVSVNWLQVVLVILLINPETFKRQGSRWFNHLTCQVAEYLAPDRLFLRLALWLVPLRPCCGVG